MQAETIFVAEVISLTGFESAVFDVADRIKGAVADHAAFPLHEQIVAGCQRSVHFFNTNVDVGKTHIADALESAVANGAAFSISPRLRQ